MFAVVSIGGFQEMVQEGDELHIPLQDAKKDEKLSFSDVLLIKKDDGEVVIGSPFVSGASVETQVVEHGRDPKIRVFKFHRRKRYMRTKGHKQDFTAVKVLGIKL